MPIKSNQIWLCANRRHQNPIGVLLVSTQHLYSTSVKCMEWREFIETKHWVNKKHFANHFLINLREEGTDSILHRIYSQHFQFGSVQIEGTKNPIGILLVPTQHLWNITKATRFLFSIYWKICGYSKEQQDEIQNREAVKEKLSRENIVWKEW